MERALSLRGRSGGVGAEQVQERGGRKKKRRQGREWRGCYRTCTTAPQRRNVQNNGHTQQR
eukprot:1910931-Pleurochrysis_carterae.AAC.2